MKEKTKTEIPEIQFTDDGKKQTHEEMEAKYPGLAAVAHMVVKHHMEKWGDEARNHPISR